MFAYVPFNLEDTRTRVWHGMLGLRKKLLGQDAALFANQFQGRDWQGIKVEIGAGKPCHICGFVMVTLTFANGWVIDTCSANEMERTLDNKARLLDWVDQLGQQYCNNQAKSRVLNLQPPGDEHILPR